MNLFLATWWFRIILALYLAIIPLITIGLLTNVLSEIEFISIITLSMAIVCFSADRVWSKGLDKHK